jgi:uncharacterized protein
MRIEGSREIPARRGEVWEAFLDPRVLAKAMPGCETLEAIGEGQYRAVMRVGVGGIKGTFEGAVRLADLEPPTTYRMMIEGRGLPGFVRGEARITLSDVGEGTGVSYVADVQVGGLVAGVGQRMLSGIARMMLDDFFARMSRLLAAPTPSAGQKA